MASDAGFWTNLGPYLVGGMALLIGAIWNAFKADVNWLKRNVTKILIHLGIEADGE